MILSLSIRRAKQPCSPPPVAARCLPHARFAVRPCHLGRPVVTPVTALWAHARVCLWVQMGSLGVCVLSSRTPCQFPTSLPASASTSCVSPPPCPRGQSLSCEREHFSGGQGVFLCSLATWVPWGRGALRSIRFSDEWSPFFSVLFSYCRFYAVHGPSPAFCHGVPVPVLQGLRLDAAISQPFLK